MNSFVDSKPGADIDRAGAARLVAQQAMDEARLGVGGCKGGDPGKAPFPETSDRVRDRRGRQPPDEEESSSWCGICSEDAAVRCRHCEADNGCGDADDEPELFCARCFKEVHRGDPEMKAHRPQALPGEGRKGQRKGEGGERKGWRNWRK